MKTIVYDKLIRHRIPEIIEASGKTCVTEILSDEVCLKMLDKKWDGLYAKGEKPDALIDWPEASVLLLSH